MKRNSLLVILLFILVQSHAFAWGYRGHKIVAGLAKQLIDRSIADSVQHYLGDMSFEDASVWMDEIRSDHSYDYLKPMHYVNVEKDKTYVKVSDPNIINELDTVFSALQNRTQSSKEATRQHLLILFHLVGDLHQPLHTGFADDKGGNAIELDFMGSKSNLHKIWDTNIIESQNITMEDCLAIIKDLPAKDKKTIGDINFISWMSDSRALLGKAYSFTNATIDQNYITTSSAIIKKQLAIAGIRLASTLTFLFNKDHKPGIFPRAN